MKQIIIFATRTISYAFILIFTFLFIIDFLRLHVPGAGVTYHTILFEIILLLIPILVVMLFHFEKKQNQFIQDIKIVGALIFIAFLPLLILVVLGIGLV